MSNVSEWAVTAGGNTSAPPDGAPENMLPGKVNDCMREIMAAVSRWYQDSNATKVSAGGTTAYTLTTNSGHTALSDIPLLSFRMNSTNTGTVTLNVDGLGAKPWRKNANGDNYISGELVSGRVVIVAYNPADDDFYTIGPVSRDELPSGTLMLFHQTSAPTGWVKQLLHDNKALRVVTGSTGTGGSTAFTSVFTSRSIAQGNLPSVNFTVAGTTGTHSHTVSATGGTTSDGDHAHTWVHYDTLLDGLVGGGGNNDVWQSEEALSTSVNGAHSHSVSVSGTTSLQGALVVSGTAASGGSGTAMDFAVQYIDVIVATKS